METLRPVLPGTPGRVEEPILGEVEVLFALARGQSDHHVQHIYDKLDVRTRAAATVRAFEHHLLQAA